MEEIENIKNELNEIKTARDNIKTALENEGETVTNDIRTYADTIPNVNKVKTVNSVEADENKNVQLDASKINIDDTAEIKQTVKAKLEALGIEIQNITVPEYSIKESTTTAGYSKSYSLTKDGTEVGVKVNIPKDLVINKGTVKVVATAGTPYDGAVVGDKYLDIELNDPTKDHIYIPVKELVDVYTAGDGIEISADNVIKSKNSNLINGSAEGSIRSKNSAPETSTYELGTTATALGNSTKASGPDSLSEGSFSESSGPSSHAEGSWTKSNGSSSHAEGTNTIASCNNSHVQGRYNVEDTNEKYAHIVGNGDESNRSNAHTIAWDGTGWFQGNVKVGGTGQDDTNAKNLATEEYVDTQIQNNLYHNYTTGETLSGDIWIDGSPVYRKVIQINSVIKNLSTFAHNISGLTNVVNIKGYGKITGNAFVPINSCLTHYVKQYNSCVCLEGSNIIFYMSADREKFISANVIIEYTRAL